MILSRQAAANSTGSIHPQCNIDPFVNEVDVPIVQHCLDFKFRMLRISPICRV
jgi:hypothetical protein